MKRKYLLITTSIFMILIGVLRALGGISLLIRAPENTKRAIIASKLEMNTASIILSVIGILFILGGLYIWKTRSRKSWNFCWTALMMFLLGGSISGYLLYGEAVDGQQLNFIVVTIGTILLYLSKPALMVKSKP